MEKINIGIIGGGASGFFSAVEIALENPGCSITILEKSDKLLSKVKVSGGGRCNVTNACFDIEELIKNYPRGFKELRSVFYRFNPSDTINWFESKGIKLKTENDNRVFPLSNKSDTIVNLFLSEAAKHNVEIITNYSVTEIKRINNGFTVNPESKFSLTFDKLIIATGGNSKPGFYSMLEKLGHTIVTPVPSLFTFNLDRHPLKGLEGISVENAIIKIKNTNFRQKGAVLVTHWGLSGPAILKLSAYCARIINEKNYNFDIEINWVPGIKEIKKSLMLEKEKSLNQKISSRSKFDLPTRLWKRFTELAGISESMKWSEVSKEKMIALEKLLIGSTYKIKGKTTFKEEFVTAGGVSLKEIDFKTMESKICKGLYFTGEVLDIDGITGGFNFQSCWSTAFIISKSINNPDKIKKSVITFMITDYKAL